MNNKSNQNRQKLDKVYIINGSLYIANKKQLIKVPPENIEKLFEVIFKEINRIKKHYQENEHETVIIFDNPAYILATLLWMNIWS